MKPGDSDAVEKLFNDVAHNYDHLNDWLSLGLHRVWKRQLLLWLAPMPGENWLDLCCGTGDLALLFAREVCPGGFVVGIDSAVEPLCLARQRSLKESQLSISWIKGDALNTGLPSDSFDGVVMAYGLRNLSDLEAGFKELHRVLKPGARAGILDFNKMRDEFIGARFQKFYLRNIAVPIAAKFGLNDHYVYLEKSLKLFPQGHEQEHLARAAGFLEAKHRLLGFGQMGALLLRK